MDDLYALSMPRGTVKRMKNMNEYKKDKPQTWKSNMPTRKASEPLSHLSDRMRADLNNVECTTVKQLSFFSTITPVR